MADGSYSRALELAASEELLESREAAVDYLRAAYRAWSDVDRMSHQVEELARRSREHQKFQLGLMLLWIRDVVLYRERGADAAIVNMDQVQAITNFIERVPDADQAAMAELVEGAIELVERNVNSRLVLTTLAQKLALAMRGRGDARLYVPLTDD
jgi:DNA polymerase-3 subunit delta'